MLDETDPRATSPQVRSLTPEVDDYDGQTIEVIRRVLKRDSIALDVGAHKGVILEHLVETAPDAKHIAIEALPNLAARLRKRFPDIILHECAVADREGTTTFQHVTNAQGYSGIKKRTYNRPDPEITELTVPLARLDDLIPAETPIALMKFDIEGGEYHAMVGASGLIARHRPTIVFEAGTLSSAHYGVDQDMFFDFFEKHGLAISTMRRWMEGDAPFTRDEYRESWKTDFYFIAYPVEG